MAEASPEKKRHYHYERETYLSRTEVLEMIDRTREDWMKALLGLLYAFGMRLNEALRLKPRDFSTAYKKWLVVSIPLSKKGKRNRGPVKQHHILRVSYKKPKLQPFVQPLLKYVVARAKEAPTEPLWKGISRYMVWHRIHKMNPSCSPHLFRHSRLHSLAMKGATGPVLRDWAGWADLRPAANYLSVTGELARKFADKIE